MSRSAAVAFCVFAAAFVAATHPATATSPAVADAIAFAAPNGDVRLVDAGTGTVTDLAAQDWTVLDTLTAHDGWVTKLAYGSRGALLVTGSRFRETKRPDLGNRGVAQDRVSIALTSRLITTSGWATVARP